MNNAKIMDSQALAWAAIVRELKRRIESGPRGTVSQLAGQLETTRGTVSKWVNGSLKGGRVPYDRLLFLMEKLSLDPDSCFGRVKNFSSPSRDGVPLIGLAACGYEWCTGERMSLSAPWLGDQFEGSDIFAVMAIGESMRPAGIEPGFLVYCDPHSQIDANDVVFVERQNGTMSLKMFRGIDGAWTILEGWLPADENGVQKAYTLREKTDSLKRIVPVAYVKRKI